MTFSVAIVGRPNVGKSTLFNRLVGRKLALVDDQPGVTRDRRRGDARLGDMRFLLFDTAGLDDADDATLEGRMRAQTIAAVRQADICLFMIDARAGITPVDKHFADLVRSSGTPCLLIANKCEGRAGEAGMYDAFGLGLGEPIALSAEHGEGTSDLYAAVKVEFEKLEGSNFEQPGGMGETGIEQPVVEGDGADNVLGPSRPLRIAVIGRPNVGKSTLVNHLIGEQRLLTGPEAGITRDSISVDWSWRGQPVKLFDTAGMRRQAKVVQKLEKLSVADTLRAVRFAEVLVLVLDATQPFERQDLHLADLVSREGRALVIAVNKWDLVKDSQSVPQDLRERCGRLLPQVRGVPMVTLSGLTGRDCDNLMPAIIDLYDVWNRRIPTAQLNRWLEDMVSRHSPPAVSGRRIRLRYMTQAKSRPPTFIVFCSRPEDLPAAYERYLVNGLRDDFGLPGIPLRIHLRKGRNPYVKE